MERPAVIGVLRREPDPVAAPPARPTFEQAQARTVALLAACVGLRWLTVGAPGFELLMLVPLWFTGVPVVASVLGLGVTYWNKREGEFVAIDAVAHPVGAKVMLALEACASLFFTAAFFVVQLGDCTGGG